MEQFQWTEQQCKDIYDHKAREEKNAELQASTRNSMDQVVIDYEYDPAKPYDVKYTPRFEPKDFPRWENVAVVNGECIPLTQQGTRMQGVSKADCLRFANGDRPLESVYSGLKWISSIKTTELSGVSRQSSGAFSTNSQFSA